MKQKKTVSILQYVFFLGLGIFLVWWQLGKMSPAEKTEFINTLASAKYILLVPVCIMMLLAHYSRALRWNILMEHLGYKPKPMHSFSALLTGYLANEAVPRLGEIVRCSMLSRSDNLRFERVLGTVIAERVFDLFCYLIFLFITLLLQINVIGKEISILFGKLFSSRNLPIKIIIPIAALVGLFYLTRFIFRRFAHVDLVSRARELISGFWQGIKTIWHTKKKGQFIGHTVFIWAMYLLQIYIGFYAINGLSQLPIQAAFSVLSLATLAMIVTPGGLGSFPFFVMQILLLYNINPTIGKAFGWLLWGAVTGFTIIVGIICFIYLSYLHHHQANKIPAEQSDI